MGSLCSFIENKLEASQREVAELRKKNAELARDMNALDGCWEKKVERLAELLSDVLKFNTQPYGQEPLNVAQIIYEDDEDLYSRVLEILEVLEDDE